MINRLQISGMGKCTADYGLGASRALLQAVALRLFLVPAQPGFGWPSVGISQLNHTITLAGRSRRLVSVGSRAAVPASGWRLSGRPALRAPYGCGGGGLCTFHRPDPAGAILPKKGLTD